MPAPEAAPESPEFAAAYADQIERIVPTSRPPTQSTKPTPQADLS